MTHLKVSGTLTVLVLGALALGARPAPAQTVAPGPYYPVPSWDQTLRATTRFIVLSNMNSQAVLDRETGLVWQRSANREACGGSDCFRAWHRAVHVCITTTFGGRGGWRLPTIYELQSLIDPTTGDLPAGHPFQLAFALDFWSTTPSPNPDLATQPNYYVLTTVGPGAEPEVVQHAWWCVRGGQGVNTPGVTP